MKIKDLCEVLKDAEKITLLIGDTEYNYNPKEPFIIDAFGCYKVSAVHAYGETGNTAEEYEIEVEIQPAKEV